MNLAESFKKAEDDLKPRRAELLRKFIPFRDGFVGMFEKFIRDANSIELSGAASFKLVTKSDDTVEALFSLNEWDEECVLVARSASHYRDKDGDFLASMIFIFPSGGVDKPALYRTVVQEWTDGTYRVSLDWLCKLAGSNEPPEMMNIYDKFAASKEIGEEAAWQIIVRRYGGKTVWREHITLDRLSRGQSRVVMGFADR